MEVVNAVKEKLTVKGNQKEEKLFETVMRKAKDNFILFKRKGDIRVLKEMLRDPKSEEKITTKEEGMFITSKETKMSLNFQVNDIFSCYEEHTNEALIKDMEDILSFEGKSEVQRKYEDEQVFVFKENNYEGEWNFNQQLEENVDIGIEYLMQCQIFGVCNNANFVMEKQGIRHSNVLCIFERRGEENEDKKSSEALTQRKGQQQKSNLDEEIENFMKLMRKKHKERSCIKRRQMVSCMKGWNVMSNVEGKLS